MKLPLSLIRLVLEQFMKLTSLIVVSAWWNLKPVVGLSLQVSTSETGLDIVFGVTVPR
jgi:hypothetical protein